MNWLISIQIFTLAVISSVSSFTWENCGPSTNPVRLQELILGRTGDLFNVTMKMNVAENLTGPIEASVRIKKKIPFSNYYIDVPCLDNLGSCDYKDICSLDPYKDKPCPPSFIKNNLPCKCPVIKNHYEVNDMPVDLRSFEDVIKGTYKLKLVLSKEETELFCLKMKIRV